MPAFMSSIASTLATSSSVSRADYVVPSLPGLAPPPDPRVPAETHLNTAESTKPIVRERPYRWIIHPAFDLFFVAGGGVFVLALVTWLLHGWSVPVAPSGAASVFLLTLLYLSQHIFADSHTTATYMRLWGSAADRDRFRFYRTWLVYTCVPLFILGMVWPPFTQAIVYAYLITVFWHYAAQAFGISLIYCYKRGYFLSKTEKQIYKWFMLSMAGVVITRILTFPEYRPAFFYGVEMPHWPDLPVPIFAAVTTAFIALSAAFAWVVIRKAVVERRVLPLPAMMLIATVACLGLSSGSTNSIMWFYVPGFFHGSQYLAVSLSYYLKERGLPEGMAPKDIAKVAIGGPGRMYLGTVIVTGFFLYIALPQFFMGLGFSYAMVAGLTLGVANYHHFITDAAIWRLRDPRCREILLA